MMKLERVVIFTAILLCTFALTSPAQAATCQTASMYDNFDTNTPLAELYNVTGTQFGGLVQKTTAERLYMSTITNNAIWFPWSDVKLEPKDTLSGNFTVRASMGAVNISGPILQPGQYRAASRLGITAANPKYRQYENFKYVNYIISLEREVNNTQTINFYELGTDDDDDFFYLENPPRTKLIKSITLPAFENALVRITYYNGMVSAYYALQGLNERPEVLLGTVSNYLQDFGPYSQEQFKVSLSLDEGTTGEFPTGSPNYYASTTFDFLSIECNEASYLPCSADTSNPTEVYRFYSPQSGAHFYTIDKCEKADVETRYPKNVWTYERIAFLSYRNNSCAGKEPVYRFYSDRLKRHFYTIDASERDEVLRSRSDVWNRYEGQAFCAYRSPVANHLPVYRFWNNYQWGHFYTISEQERENVVNRYGRIYRYEGPRFYALPAN